MRKHARCANNGQVRRVPPQMSRISAIVTGPSSEAAATSEDTAPARKESAAFCIDRYSLSCRCSLNECSQKGASCSHHGSERVVLTAGVAGPPMFFIPIPPPTFVTRLPISLSKAAAVASLPAWHVRTQAV